MKWFGPHWGAPICQYADQVPSPLTDRCEHCAEFFTSKDQGLVMPFWDSSYWRDYPVHLDCFLKSVTGK